MQKPVIAVFDKKTSFYEAPFTVRHVGDAIREWDIVRKDTNHKYGKNPEDFELFQIAVYDENLGTIENLKPYTHLASGV